MRSDARDDAVVLVGVRQVPVVAPPHLAPVGCSIGAVIELSIIGAA